MGRGPDISVKPVVRYQVKRYFHPYTSPCGRYVDSGSCEIVGTFDNERFAEEVARALSYLHERTNQDDMAGAGGPDDPEVGGV